MQLKLIAVYIDESQLEYILSVKEGLLQENFNFNFEYIDYQNNFAVDNNITMYPTFVLLKNNKICNIIIGKVGVSDLKDQLSNINYVRND